MMHCHSNVKKVEEIVSSEIMEHYLSEVLVWEGGKG